MVLHWLFEQKLIEAIFTMEASPLNTRQSPHHVVTGVFRVGWKTRIVIHLNKKGDKMDLNNYHPYKPSSYRISTLWQIPSPEIGGFG